MNAEQYYEWLSKFETKKTTDDCYTPPAVYNAVLEYVNDEVINLDGLEVVRPFYPNGDYTDLSQYDENSIVIDNPPFSLSAKIYKFYQEHGIKFFLFAPALTVFSSLRSTDGLTVIIAPQPLTYANGANVNTSFVTNLMPHIKAKTAPVLMEKLKEAEKISQNKAQLPSYLYPENVLMINSLQKICRVGIDFEVSANESHFIPSLQSQKQVKKAIFGGGLLISDRKAKELQAKELQVAKDGIVWDLSDNERQIIDRLNHA